MIKILFNYNEFLIFKDKFVLTSESVSSKSHYNYIKTNCKNRYYILFIFLEAASRQSVKYLFWKAKYYEHFHYVYKLVRDCKTRVDMLQKKNDLANPMPKDVIVKIGIVGDCTEDNIKLISKRQGNIYIHIKFDLLKEKKADFVIVNLIIFVNREK